MAFVLPCRSSGERWFSCYRKIHLKILSQSSGASRVNSHRYPGNREKLCWLSFFQVLSFSRARDYSLFISGPFRMSTISKNTLEKNKIGGRSKDQFLRPLYDRFYKKVNRCISLHISARFCWTSLKIRISQWNPKLRVFQDLTVLLPVLSRFRFHYNWRF